LSTAGASTTFSVSAGEAADSTGVDLMALAALSKTTAAWAAGSGTGGLDAGAIAANTWYHVYVIKRPDTGAVDVCISTSATGPNLATGNIPTAYTLFRRIGSMKTNGSSQWTLFRQRGNEFYWDVPVADVGPTTPSTTAVLKTISVPLGIRVKAYGSFFISGGDNNIAITSPDQTDSAASNNLGPIRAGGAAATPIQMPYLPVYTNAASQIRVRSDSTNGSYQMNTWGWYDDLGRSA